MATVGRPLALRSLVVDVAQGVGRLAGRAQAVPVGADLVSVAVGVGVGGGGLGQEGRRGRAAGGAAVGPALLLVRREFLRRAVGPRDRADALGASRS